MKKVSMKDIDNLYFWVNYFGCSYPNAYDEEEEVSASDIMQEMLTEEGGSSLPAITTASWKKTTGIWTNRPHWK